MAKFIIVAVNMAEKELTAIFDLFLINKSPNVIVIQNRGNELSITTKNPFKSANLEVIDPKLTNGNEIFPDKLRNLYGYQFEIDYFNFNTPRLIIAGQYLLGPDVVFINTFLDKHNAKPKITVFNDMESLKESKGELILNIFIFSATKRQNPRFKIINTYDVDSFCAFIPLPLLKSKNDFISRPFDGWTWCFICISMACCALAWGLLNKFSSHYANSSFYFIFGAVANFLGQAIPFREHRHLQKLILQLTLLLTFILGNAYQSLIVAYITGSHFREKILTVDEMLKGDYRYYVDAAFRNQMNESDYLEQMSPNIIQSDFKKNVSYEYLASSKVVIVESCATIDYFLNVDSHLGANNYYYKLDEKFVSFYLEIVMNPETYFYQQLQEHSLRVFESGIKKAWTELNPAIDQISFRRKEIVDSSNYEYMLNFNDITPAFYLLFIGLALSTICFFIEIFLNDFLSNIKFANIFYWLARKFKTKRRANHKIIQVRPILRN